MIDRQSEMSRGLFRGKLKVGGRGKIESRERS